MKAIISLGVLVILAIATISFKMRAVKQIAFDKANLTSTLTFGKSMKSNYTIIDTLDFALEAEEDFIRAFELLSKNQFLITDQYEDEKLRILIAEGSFSRENAKLYCSFKEPENDGNVEWQTCLNALTSKFQLSSFENSCYIIFKGKKSLGIYEELCAD